MCRKVKGFSGRGLDRLIGSITTGLVNNGGNDAIIIDGHFNTYQSSQATA